MKKDTLDNLESYFVRPVLDYFASKARGQETGLGGSKDLHKAGLDPTADKEKGANTGKSKESGLVSFKPISQSARLAEQKRSKELQKTLSEYENAQNLISKANALEILQKIHILMPVLFI
jgi:hypothetical protein